MGPLKPKTIAVTGGIGSGKTTVCRFLEDWGAAVFYADVEAKRLMTVDAALREAIRAEFGPDAYRENGSLNRGFLAGQVFGDANRLEALNALVHPKVYEAFARFAEARRVQGAPLIVRESALLPEGKALDGVDELVVVAAPESRRIDRVTQRDGVGREAVQARMQHQKTAAEFAARADRILDNQGSLDQLRAATAQLYKQLTGLNPESTVTADPFPTQPEALPKWGNRLTRILGRLVLGMGGIRWVGPLPNLKKFVMIGAPHTSNWDFVYGMALLMALGVRVNWIGKHTIFRPPFGGIMRWLGGVPVDRERTAGLVEQVCEAMAAADKMIIGLAPEGTRKPVDRWKSGFYRIAVGAGVPIVIGVIDFGNRELRADAVFEPTGDADADMAAIREHYRGVKGKRPDFFVE